MEPDEVSPDSETEVDEEPAAANGDPPVDAAVAAVKTARSKTSSAKRKRASTKRKTTGAKTRSSLARVAHQAKYPRHSVERALRIPRAIGGQKGWAHSQHLVPANSLDMINAMRTTTPTVTAAPVIRLTPGTTT